MAHFLTITTEKLAFEFFKHDIFFVYFCPFLNAITTSLKLIEKSIDGVLWIRTWGRRMVGED